jgi:pimeloyl-ACP methyl ester carboxylesterase
MAYAQNAAQTTVTKLIDIGGAQLQYVEQGAGEPVLFVHGAPQDFRAWEPIRDTIAKKHRFVAYTQIFRHPAVEGRRKAVQRRNVGR